MPNYQRRTSSLLKQTGQVLYQTKTQPSIYFQQKFSLKHANALFSKKRLSQTKKQNEFPHSKFKRMSGTQPTVGWNKWKYNGFPDITKHFRRKMTTKTINNTPENNEKTIIGNNQIKLHLKIREIMKLKNDVLRARSTNDLIKHIEDAHQNRIKHFFHEFEQFVICQN